MSKLINVMYDDLETLETFYKKEYITLNQYYQIKKKIISENIGGGKDGRNERSI